MTIKTNSPNPVLLKTINELKKRSLEQKVNLWKRIATDLEKSSRQRRIVNLSKISRHAKENDMIIVPGKVLGSGNISRKLTISAFQFSQSAKQKLEKQGVKIVPLMEICKQSPAGKKIRIIG